MSAPPIATETQARDERATSGIPGGGWLSWWEEGARGPEWRAVLRPNRSSVLGFVLTLVIVAFVVATKVRPAAGDAFTAVLVALVAIAIVLLFVIRSRSPKRLALTREALVVRGPFAASSNAFDRVQCFELDASSATENPTYSVVAIVSGRRVKLSSESDRGDAKLLADELNESLVTLAKLPVDGGAPYR